MEGQGGTPCPWSPCLPLTCFSPALFSHEARVVTPYLSEWLTWNRDMNQEGPPRSPVTTSTTKAPKKAPPVQE